MVLVDCVGEFLDTCITDGLKPMTVKFYSGKLNPWVMVYGQRDIEAMRTADLRAYIRTLYERRTRYENRPRKRAEAGGLSIESIRGHIRVLRLFWNWADKEYRLIVNPMDGIKMPSAPQPVPKNIRPEDIVALMENCAGELSVAARRDAAIIAFLADSGCRAGGLLNLNWRELDLERKRATVYEKGDKGRLVGFSEYTAARIDEWRVVAPEDSERVFCSMGTNTVGQPMTVGGLNKLLERRAKKANVSGRINPHAFRHSFARRYLLAGGDVSTLSKVMGHSSTMLTSNVYGAFLNEEALKRYDELHLMERLLRKDG